MQEKQVKQEPADVPSTGEQTADSTGLENNLEASKNIAFHRLQDLLSLV